MARIRRAIAGAVLVAACGLRAHGADGPDTAPQWRVAPDDFVHYRVAPEERAESWLERPARYHQVDDVAGVHGRDIDARGRVARPVTYPQYLYEPFVFRLPADPHDGAEEHIRESLPGNWRIGPLRVTGHLRVVGSVGSALLVAGDVELRPAADGDDAEPPSHRLVTSAALHWETTFDRAQGIATEIEYELSYTTVGTGATGPQPPNRVPRADRTYRARMRLLHDATYAYHWPGFQKEVDAAIDAGCAALYSDLAAREPEEFGEEQSGSAALSVLALLHAGRSPDDAVIARYHDWLIGLEPRRTYDVAIAMMAVEAYRTSPFEEEQRRRGQLDGWLERRLDDAERTFMERSVAFLRETDRGPGSRRAATTGADGESRWGYERSDSSRWDNSNSQYAVLGLAAAARCGVAVPDGLWVRIANHWLETQQDEGPLRQGFGLEPRRPPDRDAADGSRLRRYAPAGGTTPYGDPHTPQARGWHYAEARPTEKVTSPRDLPYGSMTVGGIASLALVDGLLDARGSGAYGRDLRARVRRGIRDGFCALRDMWSVRENPQFDGWWLYSLYALERAGDATSVERLGGRDWYWEGAVQLLLHRGKEALPRRGEWPWSRGDQPPQGTAWAVLFLERATLPAITPSGR